MRHHDYSVLFLDSFNRLDCRMGVVLPDLRRFRTGHTGAVGGYGDPVEQSDERLPAATYMDY